MKLSAILLALILVLIGLAHAQSPPAASGAGAVPWLDPGSLARLPGAGGGGGGGGGGGSSDITNILNVLNSPYNAQGDGVTDDLGPIQQAINNSFGNSSNPTGTPSPTAAKAVYLPAPRFCYDISAPLRIYGTGLSFRGDAGLHNPICPNYAGDTIIQGSWGTPGSLTYASAIVAGPGNSLVSHSGTVSSFIDLDRFLNNSVSTKNFPTTMNAHFNIGFFMKPTDFAGDQVLGSCPAYPGTSACSFNFRTSATNQVSVSINTTGGAHTFAPCPGQTANSTYELELDWNGTTYKVWQGTSGGMANLCDSFTSSNPLAMSKFEEMLLPDGGPTQFWPDGGTNTGNAFDGDIDSIRFETVSVDQSVYTVPTAKFTPDANTLLSENFISSLDGTQQAYTSVIASHNVFSTLFGGYTSGFTAKDNISNLDLCLKNTGLPLSGLFAAGGDHSIWSGDACSGTGYLGADFQNDAVSQLINFSSTGGHEGPNFNTGWNHAIDRQTNVDATDVACATYQGATTHEVGNPHCIDRGTLRYGWIENQSAGNYDFPVIAQTVSSPNFVAGLLLNTPSAAYNISGGVLSPGNTGVYIQQDTGGAGVNIEGTAFNTFAFGAPPELINYTNGPPSAPALFLGDFTYPTAVPFSNLPQWAIQQGVTPTFLVTIGGSTQLAPAVVADSKFSITLNSSAPILLPPGLPQAGPNYKSQFIKAYVCYMGSRQASDFVTNTDTSLVSATVAFVSGDVGRYVVGPNIPADDAIASITNSTTAVLTIPTTGNGTGLTETLANFQPGWTNGAGASLHGALPLWTLLGNVCDVYNWDYRDPANIFLDSYTLNSPE